MFSNEFTNLAITLISIVFYVGEHADDEDLALGAALAAAAAATGGLGSCLNLKVQKSTYI